jgi:hypothetical protein
MRTAIDLIKQHTNLRVDDWEIVESLMKEFAKLHVDAALKAACENAWVKHYRDSDGCEYDVDEDSILSAYPLENIK